MSIVARITVVLFIIGVLALPVLALSGCAGMEAAPGTVSVATAEPPCDPAKAPRLNPVLPGDMLKGEENIFEKGKVLWADYLARRAHQRLLERFIAECTSRSPP